MHFPIKSLFVFINSTGSIRKYPILGGEKKTKLQRSTGHGALSQTQFVKTKQTNKKLTLLTLTLDEQKV